MDLLAAHEILDGDLHHTQPFTTQIPPRSAQIATPPHANPHAAHPHRAPARTREMCSSSPKNPFLKRGILTPKTPILGGDRLRAFWGFLQGAPTTRSVSSRPQNDPPREIPPFWGGPKKGPFWGVRPGPKNGVRRGSRRTPRPVRVLPHVSGLKQDTRLCVRFNFRQINRTTALNNN